MRPGGIGKSTRSRKMHYSDQRLDKVDADIKKDLDQVQEYMAKNKVTKIPPAPADGSALNLSKTLGGRTRKPL